MDASESTCPRCGGTGHQSGECWGKPGFEHWSATEIRDHYGRAEDDRDEPDD